MTPRKIAPYLLNLVHSTVAASGPHYSGQTALFALFFSGPGEAEQSHATVLDMAANGNSEKGKHLSWPDMARGLGVCLVILGHLLYCSNLPWLNRIIYAFHMPMFFIVSGFLYQRGNVPWRTFLWKKTNRLLIPAFLSILLCAPLLFFKSPDIARAFALLFQDIFYVYGTVGINAPAWFFICLFEVFVVAGLLSLDKRSAGIKLLIAMFAFLGGWVAASSADNWFGYKNLLPALGFFTIGSLLKQTGQVHRLNSWLSILCSFCIWIFFGCFLNGKASMYLCNWGGNYLYFILSGITGSMCWIGIMQRFSNVPAAIRAFSNHSVFIICTQFVFVVPYSRLVQKFQIEGTAFANPLCFVYFAAVICIYRVVCYFLDSRRFRKPASSCSKDQ